MFLKKKHLQKEVPSICLCSNANPLKNYLLPGFWDSCFVFRRQKLLSNIFRTDFPIPLGSPLLGTKLEVRDANGSAVLEGEGQIFIGYFMFLILLGYCS